MTAFLAIVIAMLLGVAVQNAKHNPKHRSAL